MDFGHYFWYVKIDSIENVIFYNIITVFTLL